jgi:hypothetical protein
MTERAELRERSGVILERWQGVLPSAPRAAARAQVWLRDEAGFRASEDCLQL